MAQRRISSTALGSRLGVGLELVELVGVVDQGLHAVGGGVAGRLVAGHRQQQEEHVELELAELVALDLGRRAVRDDVVLRIVAAQLGQSVRVHEELGGGVVAASMPSASFWNSGSSAPIIRLDQSKSLRRSSWGTPISSAMACSGSSAAMSATKSHEPASATLSTMAVALAVRWVSSRPIMRGVKPLFTRSRYRVCRGGSMYSIISRTMSPSGGCRGC